MLLIESIVKLLDDFHYQTFRNYLRDKSKRSYYPLVLFDVINRDISVEQSSDELGKAVYGNDETEPAKTRKKLLQLASYTFKLTGYLAKNYPDYLQHNVTKIQQFINEGELEKATQIANMTLDVAQKIEDYDTELKVLNILIQREVLLEYAKNTQKFHERVREILQHRNDLNEILFHFNQHFRIKGKPSTKEDTEQLVNFFSPYHASKSFAVSMISRFCTVYGLNFLRDLSFYTEGVYKELIDIESRLDKYEYVILPFLYTINHRISYLKLNYASQQSDKKAILTEAASVIENSKSVLYWKSFSNQAELISLSVQLSHYINNYLYSYRDDFNEIVPSDVIEEMTKLKKVCEEMLENKNMESQFTLQYIGLTYMFAGFSVLGSQEEVKEGVNRLEYLLSSYQQMPFHSYLSVIYLLLIIGYFSLKQYDKVEETQKRYKKASTGKKVNIENNLTLQGFYLAAKWIDSGRKQYVKKAFDVVKQVEEYNLNNTKTILTNLMEYYEMKSK